MRDYSPPVYADAAMPLVATFRLSLSAGLTCLKIRLQRATLHKKDDTDAHYFKTVWNSLFITAL